MGGLKNLLTGINEKWKALSKGRKVGIIVFAAGMIVGLLYLGVSMTRTKYEPLLMDMSDEDMAKVVEQLKTDKVDYKIDGNTLLVPSDQVDDIRLKIAGSGTLPSDGKGYELFDQSKFGMTDTEMRIQYQRALETELARTIKAYDEVEQAIVHLVMPADSVFVSEKQPASASVTLKLKPGKKLSLEQVKAIVALVSASVENLPKENVVVVDNNFTYLSQNLNNDGDLSSAPSIENRQDIRGQFESELASDIKKMLEPVFGTDKVKVSVNADLDFDSKQTTSIHYDKDAIVKSQNTIKETSVNAGGQNSGSPIDNQTGAVIGAGSSGSNTDHQEETTEYDVGQTEEKTISAPGKVNRISTSVVIDGTLSDAQKQSVTNIVMAATGYVDDANRKDLINVEGIPFDTTLKKKVEQDLKSMQELQQAEERKKKLAKYIGYPAAGLVVLALLIFLILRLKSASKDKAGVEVDTVVGEQVPVNELIKNTPAVFDQEDNKPDLVGELKKYANKKPDQVVEIIKSWLAEDER